MLADLVHDELGPAHRLPGQVRAIGQCRRQRQPVPIQRLVLAARFERTQQRIEQPLAARQVPVVASPRASLFQPEVDGTFQVFAAEPARKPLVAIPGTRHEHRGPAQAIESGLYVGDRLVCMACPHVLHRD